MGIFLPYHMKGASMFCVLFCALCYMVNGVIFLPTNNVTSVADTVGLECHEIVSRSAVDLAALCVRRDSCMAVATETNNGMICSCPDGSTWPKVIDFTLHLRTRTYVTLPGRYFVWIKVNTLRPRKNGRHFADYQFKCIFLNENIRISITISLKLVPKGPINKIPALVRIMAWHRPGDKPLSGQKMVRLPPHICVTRPQWVKCTCVFF